MKTNIYTFLFLIFLTCVSNLNAQILTVNNNGDNPDMVAGDGICDDGTGNCTLRAAIEEANTNAAITDIHFSNALIISPASALPAITRTGLTIDGTTAPGASCGVLVNKITHSLLVELSGGGAAFDGLTVNAQNVTIRGLVVRGFDGNNFVAGVKANQNNATVECCYLGTNAAGTTADGNARGVYTSNLRTNVLIQNSLLSGNSVSGVQPGFAAQINVKGNLIGTNAAGNSAIANDIGVYLYGSGGCTVGGALSTERNIISGNLQSGISSGPIGSVGNTFIQGNYIGTDVDGAIALANGDYGIDMGNGGFNYTIGGTASGEGNVISGNITHGIDVNNGVIIQGNFIGTDATGTAGIPNQLGGILINTGKSDITVGGLASGAGNTIAFNQGAGIEIHPSAGNDNPIQRNQIHSNTGLGIDINGDGSTGNDATDADTGPNNIQNSPEIMSSSVSGMDVTVTFLVDTDAANATYPLSVDFYKADASNEEGSIYLGSVSYASIEAMNEKTAVFTSLESVATNDFIVATATDSDGNTSEFSMASLLPVELIRFTASLEEQIAFLDWTTASELNNEGFEIEQRFEDSWKTIGFVEGKGTSDLINNYSFQTEKLTSGVHYFRLKQMDYGDAFEYSDVVSVQVKNRVSEIQVYPNPVVDNVILEINAIQNVNSTIQIFDTQGRMVKQINADLEEGFNQQNLDLKNLMTGHYILNLVMDSDVVTKKIVKK